MRGIETSLGNGKFFKRPELVVEEGIKRTFQWLLLRDLTDLGGVLISQPAASALGLVFLGPSQHQAASAHSL